MRRDYTSHAIGGIFYHVACNGTLEGSLVEHEDMADAEAVFVDNVPALGFDSPAWRSGVDLEVLDDPPVRGGAPDHVFTDQDHAGHMAMLDSLDVGYPPQDQPQTRPGNGYTADLLGRSHMALYRQAWQFRV
jgi:hypothetical protein